MQRTTLKDCYIKTIDWYENAIIDWNAAGMQYFENGESNQLQKYHFGFNCDAAISTEDGTYAFIYQKLGTKGLLLKNGELLREINRSYYYSATYEFPAAFFTYHGRTFLVHCPQEYCRLDFEDVETGEITTSSQERDPSDFFHSRLEVSPDHKYLISKGWFWHPFNGVILYDIAHCMQEPTQLDQGIAAPNTFSEVCTASFIDQQQVLIGTSSEEPFKDVDSDPIPPGHLAIWNIITNEIDRAVKVKGEFGNVFAINEHKCWDLYKFPKIIDLTTGEIIDRLEELSSGQQMSSIIHHLEDLPKIAFNQKTKQIAISRDDSIDILS